MVCYYPQDVLFPIDPETKRYSKPIFDISSIRQSKLYASGVVFEQGKLPCSGCIGCRLEYSRQWAVRCMHESSLFLRNCFLTLTYNDDNLPDDRGLRKKDFQDFMKRFRKSYSGFESVVHPKSGDVVYPIRTYHCGEYGDSTSRPHYHACVFNFDFPDKKFFTMSDSMPLYMSDILNDLWGHGNCYVGSLTFSSAAYVARYIMKKQKGKGSGSCKAWDSTTGEIFDSRAPEFVDMSRAWGIGSIWYERYKRDVYKDDFLLVNGKKSRPPRYYDKLYSVDDPYAFDQLKFNRREKSIVLTEEQLYAKEKIKMAQLGQLYRDFE